MRQSRRRGRDDCQYPCFDAVNLWLMLAASLIMEAVNSISETHLVDLIAVLS